MVKSVNQGAHGDTDWCNIDNNYYCNNTQYIHHDCQTSNNSERTAQQFTSSLKNVHTIILSPFSLSLSLFFPSLPHTYTMSFQFTLDNDHPMRAHTLSECPQTLDLNNGSMITENHSTPHACTDIPPQPPTVLMGHGKWIEYSVDRS